MFVLTGNGNAATKLSYPTSKPVLTKSIDDGWYKAIVMTGYSKYRLNVKVEYDRVVAIDFGNGGSVHTGMNNEGYTYGGGYLEVVQLSRTQLGRGLELGFEVVGG